MLTDGLAFWYNTRGMLYALRKLIAFVFLGGIFTYIYCDFAHLWDPDLGNSVFALVLLFAAIWLVVPPAVVYCRSCARKKRNRAGYAAWKRERGAEGVAPYRMTAGLRLDLEPGEAVYFVEKATLYADSPEGFGESPKPGRVGDVAFPSLGGKWFKHQRVRIWITNHRVRFTGKDMDLSISLGAPGASPPTGLALESYKVRTGGIVFTVKGSTRRRFAFVLKNPLITSEILREVGGGG